jgi:hypothetical protein
VAYRKMVGCNSVAKLRGLGIFIYRVGCEWENEILIIK